MTCTLQVAWDKRLADYHFGPDHPLVRFQAVLPLRPFRLGGAVRQPSAAHAVRACTGDCRLTLADTGGGEFSAGARAGMAA